MQLVASMTRCQVCIVFLIIDSFKQPMDEMRSPANTCSVEVLVHFSLSTLADRCSMRFNRLWLLP